MNQLPDSLIEEGRFLWDNIEASEWALIEWLVYISEELAMIEEHWWLKQLGVQWRADTGVLQDKLRVGRAWISNRDEFPNLLYSHLRACMVDGEADLELAEWASAMNATTAMIYNRKEGREELPYWKRKIDNSIMVLEKLLNSDIPEVLRWAIEIFIGTVAGLEEE